MGLFLSLPVFHLIIQQAVYPGRQVTRHKQTRKEHEDDAERDYPLEDDPQFKESLLHA